MQPNSTQRADAENETIAAALCLFSELVAPYGPLCILRFAASDMALCFEGYNKCPSEAELDRLYNLHAQRLVTAHFLEQFQAVLQHFCAADFVDVPHKIAARAALTLTPADPPTGGGVRAWEAPPLYVIYRAQVLEAFGSSEI